MMASKTLHVVTLWSMAFLKSRPGSIADTSMKTDWLPK
jgi:hypothetical protein